MTKTLKNKKIMLATWNISNPAFYQNRDWIPLFRRLFKNTVIFSPRDYFLRFGKDYMNNKFLEIVKKEQPDYILFSLSYDEFYIDTLLNIKKISPNTKTINFFGDDEWRYSDWSRYYALFFDHIIIGKKDDSDYKKDKIKKPHFLLGFNPDFSKKLNLKKKYDVTFIGMPIRDRAEYIKYLKDNGIKITLFGPGWEGYKSLEDIYKGFLDSNNLIKVINESRINLNFSKSILKENGKRDTQLKGRVLEIPACDAFLLFESFSGLNSYFSKKSEKLVFKNKKELLEKVKYFLKHEKERERLSKFFSKEIISKYNYNTQFIKLFSNLENEKPKNIKLPDIKKIVSLSKNDLSNRNKLNEKIKNADYIYFSSSNIENLDYREFFQDYSLEKSKKQISCCDYYVYNKSLGDYLLFMAKRAFKTINKKDFDKLIHIEQLMFTKNFFLQNINKIKKLAYNEEVEIITEKNTVFVSVPLIRVEKINKVKYKNMKNAFRMKFLDKLYSLKYQKKFLSIYPYILVLQGIFGKAFILKCLRETLNPENIKKLKDN